MTTFFQMSEAIREGRHFEQMIDLGPRVKTTPQSALLLNPIPYLPQFLPPRQTPRAVNDNEAPVAHIG